MSEVRSNVNLSNSDRWVSLVAGVLLVVISTMRRGAGMLVGVPVGGLMIYKAVTGSDPVLQKFNLSTAVRTSKENVSVPHEQGKHASHAVTINRPVEDLFPLWSDWNNLPRWMRQVESLRVTDPTHIQWVIAVPGGPSVEFKVEVHNQVENEVIAWRSEPDSQIANAGAVRFSPATGGRGTVIRLEMEYVPPAGEVGVAVAKLLGVEPDQLVYDALMRFRQLVETGEIATAAGQPSGRDT